MSVFLEKSNLPQGMVSSLICGGLNTELTDFLKSRGIKILFSDENINVDKAVSKHADLSVLYLGNGRIIVDKRQKELMLKLKESGFSVIETEAEVSGAYPADCILNHTVMGEYIIGNSKIFDKAVKKECEHLNVIHTNQGYCKCSVLVVDERSIITDDESIAQKAGENGLDCLLIKKGDVCLKGHSYGFIGGACGKISKNEIMFFGDITKHRDYERIHRFLTDRDMKLLFFRFPLTDFGGIIPIKENIL